MFKAFLFFAMLIIVQTLTAQSAAEKCRYYPLHVGEEWYYKITDYQLGTDPIISYSDRKVVGDTVMPNGLRYFVINEDGRLRYERVDTLQLKVFRYETGGCTNDEKDIFDLNSNPDSTINWTDCEGRVWQVSWSDSGASIDTFSITYYSDWLTTEEKHLERDWGLTYAFTGEGNAAYKTLMWARVNGNTWGTMDVENSGMPPCEFKLFANFPNPFNSGTMFRVYLPRSTDVLLRIFNTSGQLVWQKMLKRQRSGMHQFYWNGRSFASGIYIFTVRALGRQKAQKIVLLK